MCECFYNSETGYREYCPTHEAEIADAAMAADVVRKLHPLAHCAPYAKPSYPNFYVIRKDRAEWSDTLGEGPTPEAAWTNAATILKT